MTVERGVDWGEPGGLSGDGVVAETDARAAEVVTAARRAGRRVPMLGLLGGDLCRTLGGRGDADALRSPEALRLPIDLGSVLVDGRLHWFVAHLVARRGWWRGRIVAAMNAEYIGPWDVAPRSHPDDGRLDVLDVDASMAPAERWQARARLRSGTHVPHPRIEQRRVKAIQVDLDPPVDVWLDGVRVATGARSLSIRVEPDALTCVV